MRTKPLTNKEQRDLITFRERILARALSTEPIDHAKAEAAYNALATHMGYKNARRFLWFKSPSDMHKQISEGRGQLGDQLRDQLGGQLGDQLLGQLGDQLRGQLRGQLGDQLWDQLLGQLRGQLRGQLGDQLWDQLRGQLRGQLWDQLGGQLWDQLRGQLDQAELQYYMWMEYASDLEGIEADQEKLKTLRLLSELGEHSFWVVPLEDGAAFCERPVRIGRDSLHRLHSEDHMAIEFPDGWGSYRLYGEQFEKSLWERITSGSFTAKELMLIEDTDQRSIAMTYLTPEDMIQEMNMTHLHTGIRGNKLYQCDNYMDSGKTEYALWMKDASTPREFIHCVPKDFDHHNNADEATAGMYRTSDGRMMPVEDYLNLSVEA